MLRKSFDPCLFAYTAEEWEKEAAQVAQQPTTRVASRRLARFTFSGAYPSQLDRSGRVLIPQQLRQYAGLGENIVLVGTGKIFEIWDRAAWQQEIESLDSQALEIAESAPGLGGDGK